MKLYSLEQVQYLPISLKTAWSFFSNPRNLQTITPQWLDFKITSKNDEQMYAGMIITYRIKAIIGIPMTWVTEITHVREPSFFVDEQRAGPFRFWHHQHIFEPSATGVVMQDILHYALPFGIVGQLLHESIIHNRLTAIFEFRKNRLSHFFHRRGINGTVVT